MEYQVLKDIYSEIVSWVEKNLSDMKFYVSTDQTKSRQPSDAGANTPPFKKDDWDRYEFLMSSESASFRRQLSVKASLSISLEEDEDPAPCQSEIAPVGGIAPLASRAASKLALEHGLIAYSISEVLPILRLCLDTAVEAPEGIITQLSDDGIQDLLTSLCCEIIKALVLSSGGRTLMVEDLQWCDKESFAILMRVAEAMDGGLFVCSMRTSEQAKTTRGRRYARCASFEGNTDVNSINEVTSVCKPITLKPLSRYQIGTLLRSVIRPSLISSNPNVVSDKNISNILVRSGGGIPGQVVTQIEKIVEALSRAKYGANQRSSLSNELPRFDKLSVESQIVLKMASVCGTTFSLYTVNLTLEKTGYVAVKSRTEKILVEIEEKGLIKRVFGMNDKTESKGQIVLGPSPKAADMLLSSSQGGSFRQGSFRSVSGINPKLKTYTFLDKSFRENIYNVMLESLRESVHRVIAEDLEFKYEEETRPSYQDAETLAFHYTYAGDEAKQIYYTQEAARLARETFMPLTAYHQLNRLFLLAFNQRTVEQVLQQYFRETQSSYHSNYVVPLTRPAQFGIQFVMQMYITSDDLCGKIVPLCSSIRIGQAANHVAEMSIVKYK